MKSNGSIAKGIRILMFVPILISFNSFSQSMPDSIFTKSGDTISCQITFFNYNNIFFSYIDNKGRAVEGRHIQMILVDRFSANGKLYKADSLLIESIDNKDKIDATNKEEDLPPLVEPSLTAAGNELMKASDLMLVGMGINLVITIVVSTIAASGSLGPEEWQILGVTTFVVGMVGSAIFVVGITRIRQAGQLLNPKKGIALGVNNHGIGLTWRF